MGCPVGIGDGFTAIRLPFPLLFRIGEPDPKGFVRKDDLKPVLFGFVIDRDEVRAFRNSLALGILPVFTTNFFVRVSIRGINDLHAFYWRRHGWLAEFNVTGSWNVVSGGFNGIRFTFKR